MFVDAKKRFEDFRKHIPDERIPIALVGVIGEPQEIISTEAPFLRLEESEEVIKEQGQVFANKLGIDYAKTSIRDLKKNIEIFNNLTQNGFDFFKKRQKNE